MLKYLSAYFLRFCFLLPFLFLIASCKPKEERLAQTYCSGCHLFPEPGLLDKKTWETSVLPRMAFRMGFTNVDFLGEIAERDMETVLSVLPPKPIVSTEEWEMIKKYYLTNAPDSLTTTPEKITDSIRLFTVKEVNTLGEPLITVLKIDSLHQSIVAGTRDAKLYTLDRDLTIRDTLVAESSISHVIINKDETLMTVMGNMDPNDRAIGKLVAVREDTVITLIDSLKRPVHFERADLNEDGVADFVVCEFGNFTGQLAIYQGTANGFKQHVLMALPGARKTILKDFNNDGRTDILALITQGDEQVVLFTNYGNFEFQINVLLKFPPVYGTSYFEIADFNNDGAFDILTTNGDNADYSMILKPYHGVRIYENNGKNSFQEAWSFHMPGASMAMARDFDNDGDLDIVANAFFPDFKHSEQSIIYFENIGPYKFLPQVTNLADHARWLMMETGDYDGDADIDILIGGLNFNLGNSADDVRRWNEYKTSILVFQNTTKKSMTHKINAAQKMMAATTAH